MVANPCTVGAFFFWVCARIVSGVTAESAATNKEQVMKIAILGTGMVGQAIAAALVAKGHSVTIGTRNVAASIANETPNAYGMPGFGTWHKQNSAVEVATFADAINTADLLVNATHGASAVDIFKSVSKDTFNNKILIDIANDLDMSKGMPPAARIADVPGASVGERLQSAFPTLRVVKSLSTMNAFVMVNPAIVKGESTVFVSGNDADAKNTVSGLLREFGWKDIMDLGDISTSRAVELLLPLWIRAWGVIGQTPFNFKVVR
jgi:8-hydroxy-5-deazaflavin:NADPH oxidoreductase